MCRHIFDFCFRNIAKGLNFLPTPTSLNNHFVFQRIKGSEFFQTIDTHFAEFDAVVLMFAYVQADTLCHDCHLANTYCKLPLMA